MLKVIFKSVTHYRHHCFGVGQWVPLALESCYFLPGSEIRGQTEARVKGQLAAML